MMVPFVKLILIIMFLTCWMSNGRPLDSKPSSLQAKVEKSSSGPTCWDSLFELQSCTGEVIQFFYNGEANLGHECCQAIHVIGHNCWPAMLGSLGFTDQETALLQGYCDAEDSNSHPQPPSPASDANN